MKYNLILKILASLFCVAFLAACNLPQPVAGKQIGTSADFYIAKSEVKFINTNVDQESNLAKSKTVHAQICIKDTAYENAVLNQTFEIELRTAKIDRSTDNSGCISWNEDIPFNISEPAHFIQIERNIKAKNSKLKGSVKAVFYLNPWELQAMTAQQGQPHSFKEQSLDTQSNDNSQTHSNTNTSKTRVWLEDLRFAGEEKSIHQGLDLRLKIRGQMLYEQIRSNGEKQWLPLTAGQFDITGFLVHVHPNADGSEVRRPISAPVHTEAEIKNGSIYFELHTNLQMICTRGQMQIAVRMKSKTEMLSDFEGLYFVGDCDSIKGNQFLRLENQVARNHERFSIDQYLTTDLLPDTNSSQDFYQPARIEIKKLHFNSVSYRQISLLERRRLVQVQACLKTGLDQKATRSQTFKISKVNGSQIEVRSNDDGCLYWDDSIDYNWLTDSECWSEKFVKLENSTLGVNQKLKLLINPWINEENFIRDVRFTDPQALNLENKCARGQAEIIVPSYSFDKKTIQVKMDELLNIRFEKSGNLQIPITVKRPSLAEATGFTMEEAPPGKYHLQWAILDMDAQDLMDLSNKIHDVGHQEIHVQGRSQAIATVTWSTENLKGINSTTILVLRVTPDGVENHQIRNVLYKGPLLMSNDTQGANLEPIYDNKINEKFFENAKSQLEQDIKSKNQIQARMSDKQFLAQNWGLKTVNFNSLADIQDLRSKMEYPRAHIPAFMNEPKRNLDMTDSELKLEMHMGSLSMKMAERLCMYWYYQLLDGSPQRSLSPYKMDGPSQFNATAECIASIRKNPSDHFMMQSRYFIKNPKLAQVQMTSIKDIVINTNFSLATSVADVTSSAVSWDVTAGIKLPGFSLLNASSGVRYQVQQTHSSATSEGNVNNFTAGIALTAESLRLRITMDTAERCTIIHLNPKTYSGANSILARAFKNDLTPSRRYELYRKGLMLCDGEQLKRNGSIQEDFFVLNQRSYGGNIVDINSNKGRPFFMVIRGRGELEKFLNYLQVDFQFPSSHQGAHLAEEAGGNRLERLFMLHLPSYPGQISR